MTFLYDLITSKISIISYQIPHAIKMTTFAFIIKANFIRPRYFVHVGFCLLCGHRDGPRTVDFVLEGITDFAFSIWTVGYISNLYRGPSKDAFYQVSVHLAKQLQRRRFFRNQPIRNKNCLWRPCL
jgi:hypothetical protein